MESIHRSGYDITVKLEDKPGALAALGEVLGQANVNIDGICGVPCMGEALLHILVQDPNLARRVLESAGFIVNDEQKVVYVM